MQYSKVNFVGESLIFMNHNFLIKVANAIRVLSADGVQKANSGHPGLPLGCADIAAALWSNLLINNPKDSNWVNRDRFVLSAGHGSMLIYSLLHLFGYEVSIEDLKNFRQLNSNTPGHPEYGYTHGVETTTGPLGQGIANAVGMALASKIHQKKYNTANHKIIDNHIYTLCGDGCMMEGVAAEAASLAGHLVLDNLTIIYDSNKITIEGSTDLAFSENVGQRFEAYDWNVVEVDGHNIQEINNALENTRNSSKPNLIIATTTIGKGSPNKSGSHKVHGAPLGEKETKLTRQDLGFKEAFSIPQDIYDFCQKTIEKNNEIYSQWQKKFEDWSKENPQLREQWDKAHEQEIPHLEFPKFEEGSSIASRKSSSDVLAYIANEINYLYGGSADLDCSNLSRMPEAGDINTNQFEGRNLHFGVREHAMGAICNGMQLYGNMRVYCATFLVFSDYMRHSIRLAALMKLPIIYIFTHDSIFVGEDGPTHQPVEHKASLEIIPNLTVIRPADANEVKMAWKVALQRNNSPTALLLSRQGLKTFKNERPPVEKGAYIIRTEKVNDRIDLILMASGSEVMLCIKAAKILEENDLSVRVVSMPSMKLFEEQTPEYKESVFPSSAAKRFAVDYGVSQSWYRYTGLEGKIFALDKFGESGPGEEVASHFGFTAENIATKATNIVRIDLD